MSQRFFCPLLLSSVRVFRREVFVLRLYPALVGVYEGVSGAEAGEGARRGAP